jgi:putative hydrolase of the HAD superfamily
MSSLSSSRVPYRAVFFDAGETLVYPHPSFPELFTEIMRQEGHEVDPERVRDGLHRTAELFREAARKREVWSASPERSRAFWRRVYSTIMEELDIPLGDELFHRLESEFTKFDNYRAFADVEGTLERLDRAGLKLGVVSNFEQWLEGLLESLGLTRFFDVRVISGVEGVEKPDPAIFQLGLDRHGVSPRESVYVGDNPEFDLEPAAALGMFPVLIDRRGRFPDHTGARITSLADLPALIGLNG